ncbi:restriction endonuclease subunit S [Photobacterium toruni]|uniref:restriction endonuclease subunit S n=1 Tax=Photobacterium toruni TaxID=1935446 RepID=UPI00210F4B2A|nr:restriction endonuclease subunit S [Photobacterium toruni]
MVPNDWTKLPVGSIAKVTSGGTPSRKIDSYWNGNIPWVTTSEVKFGVIADTEQKITKQGLDNSSAKLFPKDTILMAMYGQGKTRGQVAKLGIEASTNQACAALLLNKEHDVEYYYQYLISQYDNIRELANSGGQQNLSAGIIKDISVPVPPLPEQRKIAQILSTWDRGIATTEKLIDASKQQKKALMQQLLTGKKRLVDPETGKAFEGEWEEVSLSKWLIEYKEKSSIQDQHRVFTSSKSGLVPQDEYFGNSRIADRKNIGFHVLPPNHMTYRSRSDDGFFTFNLFKRCENGIISHYYPVFSSKGTNDFFIALLEQYRGIFGKHSVGTSQKVLSFNALKSIKFRIPEKDEQQKIASVLNAADKEIDLLKAKLAHFKQEKKALMQQLLTGKRRVSLSS